MNAPNVIRLPVRHVAEELRLFADLYSDMATAMMTRGAHWMEWTRVQEKADALRREAWVREGGHPWWR